MEASRALVLDSLELGYRQLLATLWILGIKIKEGALEGQPVLFITQTNSVLLKIFLNSIMAFLFSIDKHFKHG